MNDDWDGEIPSWNGQRTPTADKLAGCTLWVFGLIALMILSVSVLAPVVEAALQWWKG